MMLIIIIIVIIIIMKIAPRARADKPCSSSGSESAGEMEIL